MKRVFVLAIGLALAAATPAASGRAESFDAEHAYNTYCVQCHGLHRNGTGINVPALSVKPRDHTDTKAMGDMPDEEIFNAIKSGGLAVNKSVLMPAWGGVLNDDEIKAMVAYLRTVCKCGH